MPLVATDALVLHAFDYLESSRILRLATRDAGMQSVIARGARKSGSKYGSSVDLFVQGTAQIYTKAGRDLNNLASFEVSVARPCLAADLERFTAASAVAELVLRVTHAESSDALYDVIVGVFDALAAAPERTSREAALAGAWLIVGRLGFSPAIDECATCQTPIAVDQSASFSHSAGGALCTRCSRFAPGARVLPGSARDALRVWLAGGRSIGEGDAEVRAHQRLLREFLQHHLLEGRPLRAFEVWEQALWSTAV